MRRGFLLVVVVAAAALWVAAASPILVAEDEADVVSLLDESEEAPSLWGESEIEDLKEAEGNKVSPSAAAAAASDKGKKKPFTTGTRDVPSVAAKKAGDKAAVAATEATTAGAKTADNAKKSANDAVQTVTAAAKAKNAIAAAQAKGEKKDPRAEAAKRKAAEEAKKKAKAKAQKASDAEAGAKIIDKKQKKKLVKQVSKIAGKDAKDEVKKGVKKGWKQYKKDEGKFVKKAIKKKMIDGTGAEVAALPGPPIDKASRKKMTKKFHKKNSKEWLAYKNKEDAAWDIVTNATVVSDNAKAALKAIEAGNEIIRAKWYKVSTMPKDPFACSPVPACLGKKAKCVDTYDEANCIKARRGTLNLCELSETIQNKCCQTCRMSNLELCKKERLMLAGFGANADDPEAKGKLVNEKKRGVGSDPGSCKEFVAKEATKLKQNSLAPNFKKKAELDAKPKPAAKKPAAKKAAALRAAA